MNSTPTIPQDAADLFADWQRAYRLGHLDRCSQLRRDLVRVGWCISTKAPHRLVPRPARWTSAGDFHPGAGAVTRDNEAATAPLARRPGPSFELRGDGRAANPVTLRGDTLDSSECITRDQS